MWGPNRMNFGEIPGVIVRALLLNRDERGWLTELFRSDELAPELHPSMSYLSLTRPNVTRGPHEHRLQTDHFFFIGPSDFRLYLWDNRKGAKQYRSRYVAKFGASNPAVVIVPPGVVHAYKNIGQVDGFVFNAPNRLYLGPGRQEPVDEIRYETCENSPFTVED